MSLTGRLAVHLRRIADVLDPLPPPAPVPPADPTTIPTGDKQRRDWIKYQLGLRGTSVAGIGQRLEITRSTTYVVFRWSYPRVERAIATAIGLSPEQIWPERYCKRSAP